MTGISKENTISDFTLVFATFTDQNHKFSAEDAVTMADGSRGFCTEHNVCSVLLGLVCSLINVPPSFDQQETGPLPAPLVEKNPCWLIQ